MEYLEVSDEVLLRDFWLEGIDISLLLLFELVQLPYPLGLLLLKSLNKSRAIQALFLQQPLRVLVDLRFEGHLGHGFGHILELKLPDLFLLLPGPLPMRTDLLLHGSMFPPQRRLRDKLGPELMLWGPTGPLSPEFLSAGLLSPLDLIQT